MRTKRLSERNVDFHWLEAVLGRRTSPDLVESHDCVRFEDLIMPINCEHQVHLVDRDRQSINLPKVPAPTIAELEQRCRRRRLADVPLPDLDDIPDVSHTDLLAHLQLANYLDVQDRKAQPESPVEQERLLDRVWYIVLDQGEDQPVQVWLVHEVEVLKAAVGAANLYADILWNADDEGCEE